MDEFEISVLQKLGKQTPALIERHLGELIRLVEVEAYQDPRTIRWETVNACAVADWGRAAKLYDRLAELAPSPESRCQKAASYSRWSS
jgi:hypothetical protein